MGAAIGAIGSALGSAGSALGGALSSAAGPISAVGSLASLGSGGGGDSTTTSVSIDPQQRAREQRVFDEALNVFNTPFTPYTGNRFAGFTPDQLAVQDQARNMFGQTLNYDPLGAQNNLISQAAMQPISIDRGNIRDVQPISLLDKDLTAYQNPFTEQVIDNTLDDLNDARLLQLQRDQDAAIGRGAFGGSRSALLESETNKNFAEQAGDIASRLRTQGFDRATNLASQDIGRQFDADRYMAGIDRDVAFQNPNLQMQNRMFLANQLGNQLGNQFRTLGLLNTLGGQQQNLAQQSADFDYGEFLRQLNLPRENIGLLASTVRGLNPGQSTTVGTDRGIFGRVSDAAKMYGNLSGLLGSL